MPARVVPQQADHFPRDRRGIGEWDQDAAILRQQFRRVPIGRRNHCFARAKRVGQRARGDLRFVQVRRDIKVGGSDKLLQILKLHEIVVKDDVLLNLIFLGEHFETDAVGFAMLAQFVGMSGAQDDVNHFGKLGNDLRQCVEHVLDAFIRREQPESEQHHLAFHAELVLESRWDRQTPRPECRVRSDRSWPGRVINLLQHLPAALSHYHHARRK